MDGISFTGLVGHSVFTLFSKLLSGLPRGSIVTTEELLCTFLLSFLPAVKFVTGRRPQSSSGAKATKDSLTQFKLQS